MRTRGARSIRSPIRLDREAKVNDRYYGLETKTPRLVFAVNADVERIGQHLAQARGLEHELLQVGEERMGCIRRWQ